MACANIAGDVVFVRNVGLDLKDFGAGLFDFSHHSIRCVIAINIVHNDVGAGLAQRNGHTAANAGIRASDQRLLSDQNFLNRPLWRYAFVISSVMFQPFRLPPHTVLFQSFPGRSFS